MDLHAVKHDLIEPLPDDRPLDRAARAEVLAQARMSQALLHATLSGRHAPALTMETETP